MFDFIVSPGAKLKVRVCVRPDQAMRDQMNRIESTLTTLVQGVAQVSQAAQDATREVAETKALVQQLIQKVVDLNNTTATLAETIRANAGDNDALVSAASQLDTLQSDTQAFLGGLVEPAVSYPDRASFDAAATKYQGPKGITLDDVEVKAPAAGAGTLAYFSHSSDGHIDMTGPTD